MRIKDIPVIKKALNRYIMCDDIGAKERDKAVDSLKWLEKIEETAKRIGE